METGPQDWNFSCGVCHVGGGQMEYDRNQNDYSASSPSGDANYFSFNRNQIVPGFMSTTNKAELDCLLCHLHSTDSTGIAGAGRAWLNSINCVDSLGNPAGPANDPTCSGTSNMPGLPAAGMFTPGTNYDPYNRNLALKTLSFQYAASLGLGAKVASWGGPIAGGSDGEYKQILGIANVPTTIAAVNINPTPDSVNCGTCHARVDNSIGAPGMLSTVRLGYGNFFSIKSPGTAIEQNAAVADNGKNKVRWIEMGCKTGIGKRGQKIGAGPNDKWGMSMMSMFFGLNKAPGTPIQTEQIPMTSMLANFFAPGTTVNTKERIPDQDVHDAAGMQCATCHYAIGSKNLTGTAFGEGFILNSNGTVTIPAGNKLHGLNTASGETGVFGVDYPAEQVYGIDHQFAQGDDLKDTYGKNNLDGTVSCETCHIDQTHPKYFSAPHVANSATPRPPVPTHAGFPAIHMDKISCTTCHIPELYIAPFRLKSRDWSTGQWKKGNETDGGFKNLLDWEYDLVTGSHKTVYPLHQWAAKYEKKKITPVLASEMPIWVKLNNLGTTLPNTAITSRGSDAGVAVDDTSTIKTCSYGSRIFAQCNSDADCPGGYCWSGVTAYASPAKSRDVINAAASLDNSGVLRRPSGNMNGANLVPLFDGWPLSDAVAIDTAARIDAMSNAGAGEILKIFHANFDVTHGITPKEWALGGSKRGGCVSCHSSAQPVGGYDAQGHPLQNPNYSPNSVGFFEGVQHGLPQWAGTGKYDLLKGPFNLYADWDCTAYCGLGMPGNDDAKYFDQAGNPISGATCGDGNPAHHPYGWATIDQCVSFMQGNFDDTMGLPSGTAHMMGLNDGISALQGFMLRETVSGSTLGCNPFAMFGSIGGMLNLPSVMGNVNNCMPPVAMFSAGTCQGATQQSPGMCDSNSFRYKGMCFADSDCNATNPNPYWTDAEKTQNPYGLLLTRGEIRARHKLEVQQGKHLGFDGVVAAEGVNQLWWPMLTEQNPTNPNHKWAWDIAGAANVCGAFQNEPCCTNPMTGQPAACAQGMDVRTAIHANQLLGYAAAEYAELTKPALASSSPSALNCTGCHTQSLNHPTTAGTPGSPSNASSCKTCHLAGTPAMQIHMGATINPQTACGQCHGGSSTTTANGAPYLTTADLNTWAKGMHAPKPTPVPSPNPIVAGASTFDNNGGSFAATYTDHSSGGSGNLTVQVTWGDGKASVVAPNTITTHVYTRARTYNVKATVYDMGVNGTLRKKLNTVTGTLTVNPLGISGTVKDVSSNTLKGVVMTLKQGTITRKKAVTKADGTYAISNVLPNAATGRASGTQYTLVATKKGVTLWTSAPFTVDSTSLTMDVN